VVSLWCVLDINKGFISKNFGTPNDRCRRTKIFWDPSRATENARPDIARSSKMWGLTSRDWTTRHHVARVDITRLVSVFE